MSEVLSMAGMPIHLGRQEIDYFSEVPPELLPNVYRFLNSEDAKSLRLASQRFNIVYFNGMRELLKEKTLRPEIFEKLMADIMKCSLERDKVDLSDAKMLDIQNLSHLIDLSNNDDYPSHSLMINLDKIDTLLEDPKAFAKVLESLKTAEISSIFLYSDPTLYHGASDQRDRLMEKMRAITPLLSGVPTSISNIKLINVPINDDEFISLLQKCPSLEHLSVVYAPFSVGETLCGITQAGLTEVAKCSALQSLDLVGSANAMNQKTLEQITLACPELRSLNLTGLRSPAISADDFISIVNCSSLESLNLSYTDVNGATLDQIGENCKNLRRLDVSEAGEGINDCLAISQNFNLENLTFSNWNKPLELDALVRNHSNLKVLTVDEIKDKKEAEDLKKSFTLLQLVCAGLEEKVEDEEESKDEYSLDTIIETGRYALSWLKMLL
jgi:hypothetical protein